MIADSIKRFNSEGLEILAQTTERMLDMATRMYASKSKSNRDKSKETLRALALVDARLKGVESTVAAIEAAHWQP